MKIHADDPRNRFGEDLSEVFGPKRDRRHVSTLTALEKEAIAKTIPEFLDTDQLGDDPTLFAITNLVLAALQQCRALYGIDLSWCSTEQFMKTGLQRPSGMYVPVEKIKKNGKVQRGIQLRHLVMDILFNFSAEQVLMGVARYSTVEDMYYMNDAQHRSVGCVIVGIRSLPLEYKVSEFRSDDIIQYTAVNLRSLQASEYDRYRVMCQTIDTKIAEDPNFDKAMFDQEFVLAWELRNMLRKFNCKLIEGGGDKPKRNESTGVRNMRRHFASYSNDIFEAALKVDRQAFYDASIGTPNIWGLCEFLQIQSQNPANNMQVIVEMLVESIRVVYKPSRLNMHMEIKNAWKTGAGAELSIPEQLKIAGGIHKLVSMSFPAYQWEVPYLWGKPISESYLQNYKVPEVQQTNLAALFV